MAVNGEVGYVTVAVKGSLGPGEVELPQHGKYIAWSRDNIPIGAEVIVTAERSARAVTVAPTGL